VPAQDVAFTPRVAIVAIIEPVRYGLMRTFRTMRRAAGLAILAAALLGARAARPGARVPAHEPCAAAGGAALPVNEAAGDHHAASPEHAAAPVAEGGTTRQPVDGGPTVHADRSADCDHCNATGCLATPHCAGSSSPPLASHQRRAGARTTRLAEPAGGDQAPHSYRAAPPTPPPTAEPTAS
jgi:hypothetical protein